MIGSTRFASLVATALLIVGSAACGGTETEAPATSGTGTALDGTTVGPGTTAPGTSTSAPAETTTTAPATTTLIPEPEPPFAVGKATLTFKDTTRETEAYGDQPATPGRVIPVAIYYPAPGAADGTARSNTSILRSRPWPMLVFVHGTSMTGESYESLVVAVAQHGYVVVSPTLPITNADAPGGADPAGYTQQPGDVSFVISTMLELAARPDQVLSGRLDPAAIGVFGQSTGGDVAIAMTHACCRDERVRAVAALAGTQYLRPGQPNYPIDGYFSGPALPMLLIHGDADEITPYGDSGAAYAQAPSPKFRATMLGANHLQPSGAAGPHPSFDASVGLLQAFFDAYVAGDGVAEAADVQSILTQGDVPGVSQLDSAP